MLTFDFPYHTVTHSYPEGDAFKFGGGYEFAAEPVKPIQRTFTLKFDGLVWYRNGAGVIDKTAGDPKLNIAALIDFYEQHYTSKKFTYPHPVYGNLTVRFRKPFEVPKSLPNGNGVTDSFELVLIEQPL